MLTPEDVARMSAAQQALYAARPAWSVAATATAVWSGAAGCVGLIVRQRWAMPLLIASLSALVVQDAWLFALSGSAAQTAPVALLLQGLVLLRADRLARPECRQRRQGTLPCLTVVDDPFGVVPSQLDPGRQPLNRARLPRLVDHLGRQRA